MAERIRTLFRGTVIRKKVLAQALTMALGVSLASSFGVMSPPAIAAQTKISDVSGPVLGVYSVTPAKHNLANGPAEITIRAHITDATGTEVPTVSVSHASGQSHGFGSMYLVEGTAKNGTWERKVTIPKGAATGAWDVLLFPLDDVLGNSGSSFRTLGTVTLVNENPLSGLIAVVPKVVGTPLVGNTLSAIPGTWGPTGVKLAYQWSSNGVAIKGATKSTLLVGSELAGKAIRVAVTGSKAGYVSTTTTSAATAKVAVAKVRVVPAAPTAVAATGKYTVPTTTGITYRVNGTTKAAGTYSSGYTKVQITAVPKTGYTLSGTTSWTLNLSKKSLTAPAPSVNYGAKTLTIPRIAGVNYYVGGVRKAAGTHKVTTQVTVTAKAAAANYVVTSKTWKFDLRTAVTPVKPVFNVSANTVKIPSKTGVTYYVNGVKKAAGTYNYSGEGSVTTKVSSSSYKFVGTTSWKFDNRDSVVPTKPVFSASADTVKIPAKSGVIYLVNGVQKKTGTHMYKGKVTVTTKASNSSYKLMGTQKWEAKL